MQMPVFLVLFLAPVYVPLDLLEGWISTLANLNPATAILEAVRGFMAGTPDHAGLAFACGRRRWSRCWSSSRYAGCGAPRPGSRRAPRVSSRPT